MSSQSSTPSALPDDILERRDEEVGRMVRETWIDFQLNERGVTHHPWLAIRQLARCNVIGASRDLDRAIEDLDKVPEAAIISRAMHEEGFASAGRLYKQYLHREAKRLHQQRKVDRVKRDRQNSAHAASAEAKLKAEDRRAIWLPLAIELREKHPEMSNRSLAALISHREVVRKAGVKARTIQRDLRKAGLSPRK